MKKSRSDEVADEIAAKLDEIGSLSDSTEISSPTELGSAFAELNKDEIDPKTKQSTIDMRSNLSGHEIAGVIVNDSLCGMGVNPTDCLALSRQKKRVAPSENGWRAEQMVRMTQNLREEPGIKKTQGIMGKLFGIGDKN